MMVLTPYSSCSCGRLLPSLFGTLVLASPLVLCIAVAERIPAWASSLLEALS